MLPNLRQDWEFYASVRGRIAPLFDRDNSSPLLARHLWLFPPQHSHGWRGEPGKPATITAFHFGTVPAPLEGIVREKGWHCTPLTPVQVRELLALEKMLRPHYQEPNSFSNLVFDHALHALCLISLSNLTPHTLETSAEVTALRKVETALSFYTEFLAQRPQISEVAAAVHLSTSHLRRLFWQVRKESPQATFMKLKMQRAMHLLAEGDMKLEVVALGCGFSSASDFCRAFKAQHKVSPDAWRRSFRKAAPSVQPPR